MGNKYDGYCFYCYVHDPANADKPVVRNFKTKERAVVDFIKTVYPTVDWVFDKTVHGGCSLRRPDVFLDLGSHVLVVEVDENQHADYDCSCENKRLMELSQDVGHRPLVFLRFNPDAYFKQDVKVTSCWGVTAVRGLLKVVKEKEWRERLETLQQQIDYWMAYPTDKLVEVVQLFFDC